MNRNQQQDWILNYQQNPSPIALGEIFRHWGHLVYGVALKYLENKEEANDCVSDIFEKLLLHIPQEPIQNGAAWLHTVTKFHCLMKIRAQKAQYKQLDPTRMHASSVHEIENTLEQLEFLMTQLKTPQKQCIEALFLRQLSYDEITLEFGYSFNEIKSHIQNGKRNLRIALEKIENNER
jgi:RNA polymerase sigma-70 factor (ECF subfamily)